jgi:diguanylate cyclase (GGDEF)-like protein
MTDLSETATNRVLVVDDDALLIGEYVRCLGEDFEPDNATTTLTDLENVLFGEETDERGAARFEVHSRNQGDAAVDAVRNAVATESPYAIVFIDIRMPPGMDGIEAARQIRALDPNINIVIVTGSMSIEAESLIKEIPPSDKIFFFKKPFHAVECRQLAAALCGKWHADMALRSANEDLERRVEERTAALHRLAYYDPVTDLPNQHLLLDELQSMIELSEDADGDTVTVLIDIDRFSFINETMGYDSGTELLRSVGNRLRRELSEDEQFEGAVVGRFGADEFAILVPHVASQDDIQEITQRVRAVVEQPFLINGRDLFLKTAIGAAWHPDHGRDARSVYRCAEAALHRSMRTIDNATTYYHREMRFRARHKFDMEAELRCAIDEGQIQPWYQPQQDSETGELGGVEALARWIRPDGSIVPPADFIPLSEEMGISDVLFETILGSVCRDVAAWQENSDWDVPVSVNLSPHQLRNGNLVSLIKKILVDNAVNRKLINLELTETVLLEDLTVAEPLLQDLSAYGVGIHIDDFGTGYSSLSYLAQLPVQAVKIDRTFISKLVESETTVRVVQAVVALGKAMKLKVVAEGVETDQQYAIVRRLGCDLVQGFFIAKPMPADRFMAWCGGHEDTQSLKHGASVVGIDSATK